MSKRQWLLLVLLLAAALLVLSGCQQAQPTEEPIRLWIWSQWNGETGVEPNGQPLDWWNKAVAEWQAEHPGVEVEIEDLNGQDVDINAKYDTAAAAGNIADILWVDESYFSKYARVSMSPRSFIATMSMSLRPCATLRNERPIRPNPLIATRSESMRDKCGYR
jgi:ABC-type glycerol-3-phosphate transport system substrate-binding protein